MTTQLQDRQHIPFDDWGGPSGRPGRWLAVAVAVVAILGAALIGTVIVTGDDDDTAPTTQTTASSVTTPSSSSSTATTPSTSLPSDDRLTAVFPTDGTGYDSPPDAAEAFAEDLGFRDPVLGAFQQGDSRSGEVEIRPVADGPVTTVFVRQLGSDEAWFVVGAATASIQLDSPTALEAVSSPVRLRGRSTAFEATVGVEIRQDAQPFIVGQGFVMGGANGQMGPFDGTIALSNIRTDYGTILLRTMSMEDGSTWEAAAVRVRFEPAAGSTVVAVYFHVGAGDDQPVAFTRTVPATRGVLRVALEQLLLGPTASERAAGATSFFTEATAGMLLGVTLEGGAAIVDFGDLPTVIPNASSSAGSAMLLAELDATVFQFDTVDSVLYRIDGNAERFYSWLQLDVPEGQ